MANSVIESSQLLFGDANSGETTDDRDMLEQFAKYIT